MNEYEGFDDVYGSALDPNDNDQHQQPLFLSSSSPEPPNDEPTVDFTDPAIADLPRVLLMGPRRGGKTSIQVSLSVCRIPQRCLAFVGRP